MTEIDPVFAVNHYGQSRLKSIELFRKLALSVDDDPSVIHQYASEPIIQGLLSDRTSNCLDRVRICESLSYGDAGVLLSCPGPSLAGILIRELASEDQKAYFFGSVERHHSTTFFALTEPEHGSDISGIQSSLKKTTKGNYILNTHKWFVGHAIDAKLGVLIVRQSKGPLGLCCLLLDEECLKEWDGHGLERKEMNTLGLRGARLSSLTLKNVTIGERAFLGLSYDPVKRGMLALLKVFNQMRPVVSAFALGLSQALIDYLIINVSRMSRETKRHLESLNGEAYTIRQLLYAAAEHVDKDTYNARYSSEMKVMCTRLIEKICHLVIEVLGHSLLYEHRIVQKWLRDAWGFEFMEGSSHINLLNVYNSLPLNR